MKIPSHPTAFLGSRVFVKKIILRMDGSPDTTLRRVPAIVVKVEDSPHKRTPTCVVRVDFANFRQILKIRWSNLLEPSDVKCRHCPHHCPPDPA